MLPIFPRGNNEEDAEEVEEEPPRLRAPRWFRDAIDPLQIPDRNLIRYYRFPRQEILNICDMVREQLEPVTDRSHAIPLINKVLACLRFTASGSFQNVVGDVMHFSQPSTSRILRTFTTEMARQAHNFIKFRLDQPQYIADQKRKFEEKAGFPNVIGCKDCTHVNIRKPSVDGVNYINRKGDPSINVQIICDADQRIINCIARWPGASHDAFIWEQSEVKRTLEQWGGEGWLLGDSAYTCTERVLTPLRNPVTEAENRYQQAHISTRNIIERTNGVWKMRQRCIDKSGGTLQYTPDMCVNIILTTAVLHNICIDRRIPLPDDIAEEDIDNYRNDAVLLDPPIDANPGGLQIRQELINNHFGV